MALDTRAIVEQAMTGTRDDADDASTSQPPDPSPLSDATADTPPTDATPARGAGSAPAVPATSAQGKPAVDAAGKAVERSAPIPQARHQAILDNARKKERLDIGSKLGISLADESRVADVAAIVKAGLRASDLHDFGHFRAFQTDPAGYLARFAHQFGFRQVVAGADTPEPTTSPASPTRPRSSAPFKRPTPILRSEDGRAAYDDTQINAIIEDLTSNFEAQLAEVKSAYERTAPVIERVETEERRRHVDARAEQYLREVESRPGFEECREEMARLLETREASTVDAAYARAVQTHYLPFVHVRERQKILDELDAAPVAPKGPTPAHVARVNSSDRPEIPATRDAVRRGFRQQGIAVD